MHTSNSSAVLLAWERGRNLGHISRLLAIRALLDAQGSDLVWALPRAWISAPQCRHLPHVRHVSPEVASASLVPMAQTHSFADVLLASGFADTGELAKAVQAWIRLFDTVQPRCVVLDYAPVAQLAALLISLPAFQITNGFDAPPPECPIFGLFARGAYLDRCNAVKTSQLSVALQRAGRMVSGRTGPCLAEYLAYPFKVYDCIPETDPYGPRNDGLCVGPLVSLPDAGAASWPAGAPGLPRVFGYLRNLPGAHELLDELKQQDAVTLCVWPDASPETQRRYQGSRVKVVTAPVDLNAALCNATTVVNYGSITTVCQSLLAGKPQLMCPNDVEKTLVAKKVVSHGAGLIWRPGESAHDAIEKLLTSSTLRDAAARIARRYMSSGLVQNLESFGRRLAGREGALR